MSRTFEELHPDTYEYIKANNLQTTVYQYSIGGELVEQWEKIDGVWRDVSKRALLEKEIEDARENLGRIRVALRLKKF